MKVVGDVRPIGQAYVRSQIRVNRSGSSHKSSESYSLKLNDAQRCLQSFRHLAGQKRFCYIHLELSFFFTES